MSTYPYLPGLPDDEDENSASAISRKRLASFARYKRPQLSQTSSQGQKEKEITIPTSNAGGPPVAVVGGGRKDGVETPKIIGNPKQGTNIVTADGKTATRSDVKETLKSMGLRCEDFTISVYSREQAHAILRRQGVEVTPNNLPSREKLAAMAAKGGFRNARSGEMQRPHNMRGMPPTNTWPSNTRPLNTRPPNIRKPVPRYDDDDDDCVILDPPDMPKPPPVSLPQQFQLMGTTVQVNRGAKRPNRPMMNQPQAKRPNARPMQYYHKEHEEYGAEASVQDTLKRLKNYNISITCRRNASGLGPRGPMDSDSEMEDENHLDSDEEEEDMTKYLECQIGEIDDIPDREIYDEEDDIECEDKDDVDYNPRGKKKRRSKSPRKGRRSLDPSSMLEQGRMLESGMAITGLDSTIEMDNSEGHKNPSEPDMEGKDSSPKTHEGENSEELESPMKTPEHSEDEKEGEDHEEENADEDHNPEAEEQSKERESEEPHNFEEPEEGGQEEVGEGEDSEENENFEENENIDENKNVPEGSNDEDETKEDNNTGNVEDIISKEMEEEEEEEQQQVQGAHEDEEIDAELEKELLAGDVGEDGDMEEEL